MTSTSTRASVELPAPRDRPADSDGLPTGAWLKDLEEDGYRGYTWSGRPMLVPLLLTVVVMLSTLALAWLWWDRIPDQVALHTGADGTVDRWGDKTIGNVLMAPLLGGGGMLLAMAVIMAVGAFFRPRPPVGLAQGAHSLGSMVRQSATMDIVLRSTGWSLLIFSIAISLLEVPRWRTGYENSSPIWLIGVAVLAMFVIPYLLGRRVREMVDRELDALGVPVGPETERELHAWRYVAVVDDPGAGLWVPTGTPSTNWTVNIARPAGKVLAFGFLAVMAALGMFLLLSPLIFG